VIYKQTYDEKGRTRKFAEKCAFPENTKIQLFETQNYQYRHSFTSPSITFRGNPTHHSCQGTCKSGIVQAKTLNLVVVIDKGKGKAADGNKTAARYPKAPGQTISGTRLSLQHLGVLESRVRV
jgi:hypothetical protein